MKKGTNRLSQEDRLEILARLSHRQGQRQVARELGCGRRTVQRVVRAAGGMPQWRLRLRPRSPLRLSLQEREEIRAGIASGDSFRAIARRIDRAPSTISR
jgi:transposase, IS30 family